MPPGMLVEKVHVFKICYAGLWQEYARRDGMNAEKEIGCCNLEERRCGAGGAMYSGAERSGASNEYVAAALRCGAVRCGAMGRTLRCGAMRGVDTALAASLYTKMSTVGRARYVIAVLHRHAAIHELTQTSNDTEHLTIHPRPNGPEFTSHLKRTPPAHKNFSHWFTLPYTPQTPHFTSPTFT